MKPTLRPYQLEAACAVLESWGGGIQRPALQLATGLGKTVILAELARLRVRAGRRPVILVHRDELVRQTVDKLHRADPELRLGIVQGQNLGIARTDVVVASVQTLIRRIGDGPGVRIQPSRFDDVIVDECHHAGANSYLAILRHFGALEGDGAVALGVTATMARGDGRGLGDVWDKVVYERGIAWGVEHGHLVPAEVRTVRVAGLDTDKIRKGADGDLAVGQLGKAMSQAHAGDVIARAYSDYGRDAHGRLRRAISFAPTVEVAEAWAGAYRAAGARCAVINGTTAPGERQAAYRALAAGSIDVLSSVMVLTEGFDLPAVEVAIVGRPTKSMPLLTQMVGRVLRPSPGTGKTCALLLDVVGALGHGLARSFDLSIPGPDVEVAPREPRAQLDGEPAVPLAPPTELEWVARDLLGNVIAAPKRRKGFSDPTWLRTYGGIPFLPASKDHPERVYCLAVEGAPAPWWRKARGGAPEPLILAPGADPRDLHPGIPDIGHALVATDRQLELLSRLGLLPAGFVNRATATRLIEIHFASADLDGLTRGPVAPPPGVS